MALLRSPGRRGGATAGAGRGEEGQGGRAALIADETGRPLEQTK